MSRVIVLNLDFTYLNSVPLKKAIKYIISKKAEIVKATTKILTNAENTIRIKSPLVVRLIKMVRIIYRSKVPFSRKNILSRDEHTCQYCNCKTQLTIDHIIPASRGGKSNWENCVAACKSCNNKKGNKTPREAKMQLNKIPHQPTIMEFLIAKVKSLGIEDVLNNLNY